MPRSDRFTLVAVLACVLGVVGYAVFGWRFGDDSTGSVAFAVALVAVGFAVVATLRDR